MPLNNRQRLVLINALKGMTQTDAYAAVYGKDDNYYNLAQRASNLFNNMKFKAELERLQNEALEEAQAQVLSKAEKRTILAAIARARLADLLDDNGNLKLDKKNPSIKALKEFSHRQSSDHNGNPIISKSAKLLDPIAAIIEDNKMSGDYAPSRHLIAERVQFEVIHTERREEIDNADIPVALPEGDRTNRDAPETEGEDTSQDTHRDT